MYQDNFVRILEKYQTEHNFFSVLGDAKDFVINLTKFSDKECIQKKMDMERRIRELVIARPSRLNQLIDSIKKKGFKYTANRVVSKILHF